MMRQEIAIFGGGCFWCLDALFRAVEGVASVECGYAGGHILAPDYESVCRGTTGHAEVVRIGFDPAVVPYETLLTIFFACHDPTTPNRQGNDVGTQYRSLIVCADTNQLEKVKDELSYLEQQNVYGGQIITEVRLGGSFFPAEAHHQNYFERHPDQGYCRIAINPKLALLRKKFAEKLRC